MLSIISSAAYSAVDAVYFGLSPNIIINLIKQEPDPVEPGKQVEVSFKLDNNGTSTNNMIFGIIPEYPFELLPGESTSRSIGTLGSFQTEKQSVIVKFKLKVAQDAPDSSHQLRVRYKNDDINSWVTLEGFKIRVQTHDAILAVDKFSTTPQVTAPGSKTKLRVELKSYASSLLKDIRVSLNLDKSGDDSRPFAPVGSTNEKVIPYIEAQETVPVEFELLAESDAASKAYKIPLILDYSDSINKNYSKRSIVAIVVGEQPDLGVTLERTDVYSSDTYGNVVLRLVNKGNTDIKFLNVEILPNENVKVIGAREVYIGKLDSDDFSTAEFKLFLKGKDSARIPVQVTYKDANNNSFKEKREVELMLYSDGDAKNFGVKKSSSLAWIIAIVIAAVIGYYFYRKIKARK